MCAHRNRLREANNYQSQAAYEQGLEYERKGNLHGAYSCYLTAASKGYAEAAQKAKTLSAYLKGIGQGINPREHKRNLEQTNKPITPPKMVASLKIPSETSSQMVTPNHRKKHPQQSRVKKTTPSKTSPPPTTRQRKEEEFRKLKDKAKEGDAEAQYLCGIQYLEWALKYLNEAATQNHAKAGKKLRSLTPPPPPPTPAPAGEAAPAPLPGGALTDLADKILSELQGLTELFGSKISV